MRRATHRNPTFYYVGTARSVFTDETTGLVFAECGEGRTTPRFLLFDNLLSAEAHFQARRRQGAERGITWEIDWTSPGLPPDEASIGAQWERLEELMLDAPDERDSAFWRRIVTQDRRRRAA